MKDGPMVDTNKLLAELSKLAKKHSKHQRALHEIRAREGEICDQLYKETGEQRYGDASAYLRMADGMQRAAHAQDDMAGCWALDMPIPGTRSR